MTEPPTPDHDLRDGITLTRVFDAPRERVWREWTEPERFAVRWWGEYREVVAPERLVFTVSDTPEDNAYEVIIVVLTDNGDASTEMFFQQRGRMAPERYEATEQGWSIFFDRLDERLATG